MHHLLHPRLWRAGNAGVKSPAPAQALLTNVLLSLTKAHWATNGGPLMGLSRSRIAEASRGARLRAVTIGFCLMLAAGAGPAAEAEATSHPSVIAFAVDVSGDARKARLAFTISGPVEAKAFLLERPDRVIIDLAEVNFQLPAGSGLVGASFVASFRYGLFAPGRSRIVIDLKEPALVSKVESVRKGAGETAELIIELARSERAAYRQAALKPMVEGSIAPAREMPLGLAPFGDPKSGSPKPAIVIDPGHGGVDNGAISASGVVEKQLVFAFAQKLKAELEATAKYRVLMTRDSDTFVSLPERVRMARLGRAALFLSIHADILSRSPSVRGATVYTGSELATDKESAHLADKENRADSVAGVDSRDEPEEVAGILMDLTKRETRAFSGEFARELVADLSGVIKLNKNPHRSAGFRVLKAPDVPSVLIELGYLSSLKDADLMNSDAWRERTAGALAAAVDRYFAPRVAGRRPDATVSP